MRHPTCPEYARATLWALALVLAAGCTRDNPDYVEGEDLEPDAEMIRPPDAAPVDGQMIGGDGGGPDVGEAPDAGPDAVVVDAEPIDRGPMPDAGVEPDLGLEPDLGPPPPVDGDGDGFTEDDDCADDDPDRFPGAPERCNGVDDDCDGPADEGWAERGLGEPCTAGLGACAAAGVRICADNGDDVVCGAAPGPAADEVCNATDDDCDGIVDEGAAGCCAEGEARPCGNGVGQCAPGLQTCDAGGVFGPCEGSVGPEEEDCDGVDDDCDGRVDEGFGIGGPCAAGVGACRMDGVLACAADGLGAVCDVPAGEMMAESCNGIDDDCDGTTDEGFDVGAPCAEGVGACARNGRIGCLDGGAVCDAEPGRPEAEVCNGLDDDCDGPVDESVGGGMACEVGQGACRREGTLVCNMAGELACDVAPGMRGDEICNGIDDDCDGVADEPFADQIGQACEAVFGGCTSAGVVACDDAGGVACNAPPPVPVDELCNGIDDDCDENVDEPFPTGEGCAVGVGACSAGGFFVCAPDGTVACDAEPGAPVDEQCNGVDDDCDETVDEGFDVGQPCVEGIGRCASEGVRVCAPEGPVCDALPGDPEDEICNGEDDDCDGVVDEGVLNACGQCGDAPEELCNAEDDDCDGQVDEEIDVCLFHLGAVAAPEGAAGFGRTMADAGDLDGDGISDALVGAPSGEAGFAAVVSGADGSVVWQVQDIVTFGTAVAAGDLDGDGVRELFVGAPGLDNGYLVQLDPAGEEVRRVEGDATFRAGRQIAVADGAPWVAMGDEDARATFFGPAGALRVVRFGEAGPESVTFDGEAGEAMGERVFAVPDVGQDGVPDVVITGRAFVDRGIRVFVDPPADNRTEVLTPGGTNRSFGEGLAYGRFLQDEEPLFAIGADLAGNRQSGLVFLYDRAGQRLDGQLTNGGRNNRQGYRLATLPRPDRDALVVGALSMGELRVWQLLRAVDGRPVLAISTPVQVDGVTDAFGSALAMTAPGPDGTRRLFVGEPDAMGGGRVHIFSAR